MALYPQLTLPDLHLPILGCVIRIRESFGGTPQALVFVLMHLVRYPTRNALFSLGCLMLSLFAELECFSSVEFGVVTSVG